MRLIDLIFPPRADERVLRDISLDSFCALASPQTVPATRPACVGLTLYSDKVARAAVHEAKYHGSAYAFNLLAALLADFLPEYLTDQNVGRTTSYILVPVPLGRARRRERGYNQAEEVARRAARLMGDPHITLDTALLERTRETPTQVSLARKEREANMRGAFIVAGTIDPAAYYVLIDDVLTTGATLGAAIEALASAGVTREKILPLALAYQP